MLHEVYRDGTLPTADDDIDLLFSMGGPMGVYDHDRHPWILDESLLLAELVERRVPVIGICLGAQMLAHALGSAVAPHTHREVGWHHVSLSDTARQLVWMDHLPDELEVFMWHGDRYEHPAATLHVASSPGCDNHAFVTADGRALGVQFHPEFAAADIQRLIDTAGPEQFFGPYSQQPAKLADSARADNMRDWFWMLLDGFVAVNVSSSPARSC